jgi:MoaA/NifB/PqqE/SkfB family radical SAM enzyme
MALFKKLTWDLSLKHYNLQKSICELKSVGVEITNRCNLQCKHCYMCSDPASCIEATNTQEWLDFFNDLKKDFTSKVDIHITGGEPLVRKDIFVILDHLKKLKFSLGIVTNGLLLTPEIIGKISKYTNSLSISLDGFEESHDYLRNAPVFKETLNNIKNIKKHGISNITIKTTVYKKNLNDLKDFYVFIQELDIDQWHLFAMEPMGRGDINNKEILSHKEYEGLCSFVDEIKKDNNIKVIFGEQQGSSLSDKTYECSQYKLCHAGISTCAVLFNGDIVNCIQGDRNMVYGNIKKDSFKDVWDNQFKPNRKSEYRSCKNHYFDK